MRGVQHEVELAPSIYYGSQNGISIQDLVSCSDDQTYSSIILARCFEK